MTNAGRWDQKPNVVPWPPLIYALAAVAGFGLGHTCPIGFGWVWGSVAKVIGGLSITAGLDLDLSAMIWMRRQRANILPNRAATALVTTGPFAVSRNPIYLGNTLVIAGAALAWDNPWYLPAALIAAFAVDRLAIRREEAHLIARYGDAWRDYAQRTPRWLLPRTTMVHR